MTFRSIGSRVAQVLGLLSIGAVAAAGQSVNVLTRMFNADGGFGSYGAATTAHSRIRHSVLHSAELRGLVYFNGGGAMNEASFWLAEMPSQNPIEVKAALIVNGQTFPLFRDGVRDVVMQPGALVEMHLAEPVEIHPGDEVVSVTRYRFTPGSLIPRGTRLHWVQGQPIVADAFFTSVQDVDFVDVPFELWNPSASNGPPVWFGHGTVIHGPAATLATRIGDRIRPSVEVWGTSRVEDFPLNRGGYLLDASGIFGRALAELGMPYWSFHRGASRAWVDTALEATPIRRMLGLGSDVAIFAHGVNDWHAGRTVAQFQAAFRDFARMRRTEGKWVLAFTEYPNSNSVDAYTTLEGQVVKSTESRRIASNEWIRGTISDAALLAAGGDPSIRREDCFDDYIEVADAIESSRNSGRFLPGPVVRSVSVTSGSGNATELAEGGLEVGRFHDYLAYVTEGTGAGQFRSISGNDEDTLFVFEPWTTPLDDTSRVAIVRSMVGYPSPNGLHASSVARELIGEVVKQKLQELTERFPIHVRSFRPLGDGSVRGPLESLFHPDGKTSLVSGRNAVSSSSPLGFRASFRGTDFRVTGRNLLLRAASPSGPVELQIRHRVPGTPKWRVIGAVSLGPSLSTHEIAIPEPERGAIPADQPLEIEAQIVEAPRNNRGLNLAVDFLRLVLDIQ